MTPLAAPLTPARRSLLERRIRWVVAGTIGYNVVEAVVALSAGRAASSSALVGFGLDSVVEVLSKHEAKMATDVRLANNYFEALFQKRQLDKVTKLLNALVGSSNREVKQFAIERSRMVAQYLQQQQQKLPGAGAPAPQRRA